MTRPSERPPDPIKGRRLHAFIGAGTGPYEGILAGLTYTAGSRLALMLEYAPEGPLTGRRNSVNVGARFGIGGGFRVEAALFDFDNVGVGISFLSGIGL